MDDKLNILSIKILFQFKVASLVVTDKADKVEIFGTTIDVDPSKGVSYDILSRVAHHDDIKLFKPLVYYIYYFDEENNNILIPKVGLRVLRAGTCVIEPKFNIKI